MWGTNTEYENVGDARHFAARYKSKILASFRVFMMKHHYFYLSKYLLGGRFALVSGFQSTSMDSFLKQWPVIESIPF